MEQEKRSEELRKCLMSPAHFINKYCRIKTKSGKEVPFRKVTDEEIAVAAKLYKTIK